MNEEIRLFKDLHGEARVLALITQGNPDETGSAGSFPPALRFHVDGDGRITGDHAEPIAADIRPGQDGRRLAKLKLVAGLTGLALDALVQREARRQRWLAGIAAAQSTAALLAQDPDNPDRMFDHAQSVFYVGQLALQQRDFATAEQQFRRHVELADAMLATDPTNPKWRAETGYAANSLGALDNSQRKPAEAIAQFERYVTVTGHLAAAQPGNRAARRDESQARAWLADAHLLAGDVASARAEREAEALILPASAVRWPRHCCWTAALPRRPSSIRMSGPFWPGSARAVPGGMSLRRNG